MVIEALTEQMQADGRALTQALDDADLRVASAFWFYFSDVHQWRFVFASPIVDSIGPRKSYKKVQRVIQKLKQKLATVDLTSVVAVSAKHPLIQLLKMAIGTGPGISAIRFSRNTVNGQFIEDAFIYRMNVTA